MTIDVVGDGVDEVDIALLDALHLNPLASFEELGKVLEISPVTAARRWRRLVSTGRAWVSSAPGPQLPSGRRCSKPSANPVPRQRWPPNSLRYHRFSASTSLPAKTTSTPSGCRRSAAAGRIGRRHAAGIAGLNRVQSSLMTELFSGTRWRLGGLSSDQVRAVTPEPAKTNPAHEFDEFDRELFLALQRDGRLSFRDLAAAVGRPEPTVRRRLGLLTQRRNAGVPNRFRAGASRLADRGGAQAQRQRVGGRSSGPHTGPVPRDPILRRGHWGSAAANISSPCSCTNVSDLDP